MSEYPTNSGPGPGPRKRVVMLFVAALILIAVILAELGARVAGYRPWIPGDPGISVSPGNHFFQKDESLGWKHLAGRYVVTLKDNYQFTVTHTSDTLRITRPLVEYDDAPSSPSVWLMGCSFTHGWSINDEETFPYLVQKQMPQVEIINFGVSGYGVLHSVLQFRNAIKTFRKPQAAILIYGSYLDDRTTFSRSRRKAVAPWNYLGLLRVPYARFDENGEMKIQYTDATYRPFPLMGHSAFVHLVEQAYNRFEDAGLRSHELNRELVRVFRDDCVAHGVQPALAVIVASPEGNAMIEHARSLGMPATDFSIDFSRPEFSNMPHDPHPSALAQIPLAENMTRFLEGEVLINGDSRTGTGHLLLGK